MIHKIFSIFDSKAMAYLPPFILPRKEQALRVFSDCCNAEDHQFGKHPEDYTLFTLGEWDDETAQYDLVNPPLSLGNGVEFRLLETKPETTNGAQVGNDPPIQSSSSGSDTT